MTAPFKLSALRRVLENDAIDLMPDAIGALLDFADAFYALLAANRRGDVAAQNVHAARVSEASKRFEP